MLKTFINWNLKFSMLLDGLLPDQLRRDGNRTYRSEILPSAIRHGDVVYECGGGSQPFLGAAAKRRLQATVIGLDIDGDELLSAPEGAYDRIIVADLCNFEGTGDADAVICQATLEHVPDAVGAMKGIASTLRAGGRAFIFAPSRNAAFARLNLILPQKMKRHLLFALFPKKAKGHDGFKAYYNCCTPSQIEALAASNGLIVEDRRLFWTSSYFFIFTPAFVLWRVYQVISYLLLGDDAAETFIYVLRKSTADTLPERS